MNTINKYTFVIILFLSSFCLAFETAIKYEKDIPLAGGMNSNKNYLQGAGVNSDKVVLRTYFDSELGYSFGLVYSREAGNYVQIANNTRAYNNLFSSFTSIGPEVGIWIQPTSLIRIESGFSLTSGPFNFKDSSSDEINMSDTKKADIFCGLVNTQSINSAKIMLNAKLGYYKIFINEFDYKGISYSKDELNFKQYLYISVGLGISF